MRGRFSGINLVEPTILKVLKISGIPMSTLAINYRVNESAGRTVNLNVIKNNLKFLVKNKKISEKFDREREIVYYRLVL